MATEPCPSLEELRLLGSSHQGTGTFRRIEAHVELCVACTDLLEALARQESDDSASTSRKPVDVLPAIPGFVIVRKLGQGGAGTVYEALQISIGRKVALKLLSQERLPPDAIRQRWLTEARALGQIRHPHVVRLLDAGEYERQMYLVLELISGGTLKSRMTSPIPIRTVDVTGYGGGRSPGATGATNYGVQVSTANSTTANTAVFSYIGSSDGAVNVTGFGGGGSGTSSASSGWYNYGVYVYQGGKITSGGNADVTVNGTGGGFGNSSTSSGVNAGVVVCTTLTIANLGETFPTITSGGNGNVTINGQGGGSTGSGANNWGVGVQGGGLVTSGGMGTVSITGVAGDGATNNQNVGVWVCQTTTSNVSSTVTSGGGNVVVNGTGGGKNSQYNVGVLVSDSGLITAPGTASVSVTGRGGNANSNASAGTQAHGVWVYGSGSKQIRPKITSTNGTVTVTGYGGNSNTTLTSSAGSNYGVYVSQGGEISTGGTAPLTVTGNGGGLAGGTSTDNVGVYVSTLATGNLPGQITSSGGTVTVTGSGGGTNPLNSGTGTNHGVSIAAGGQITTTGSGTSINITGTGGGGNPAGSATNHGILIAGCTTLSNLTITSNGGPITLNATEGLGSQSRGITTTANAVIGNATTSGNITILTNSASLSSATGAAINAAGRFSIAPITPGTSVILGCTTDIRGELRLSAAELNTLSAGTIQIGTSSTGNFTVAANVTIPAASNLTLISNSTSSTGIGSTLSTTITMGAGKTLDVSALPSLNTSIASATNHSQLNVVGNLSIAGKSLNLSGSYTPVSGDVYTVANATSLTGTFTGLANGSTTTYKNRTLIVNYTPTTVTLTEPSPKVITQPTSQTVTAGATVTFNAAATGIPTPSVQWQVLAPGGSWSNITNATSPTYSFTTAAGDNGSQYRAYFLNTYGDALTNTASLSVQFAPSITSQPGNLTITDGQTATFTAAATGNPTPTVQWQVNTGSGWAVVTTGTGGTTNSYTTAA
ncbi:MAG: protein kinase, partial [Planctomycetia bacterium]